MRIRTKVTVYLIVATLTIAVFLGLLLGNIERETLNNQITLRLQTTSAFKVNQLKEFVRSQKELISMIAASSAFRDFLIDLKTKSKKEETVLRLQRSIKADAQIQEIFILDTTGKIVASTDTVQEGKNRSDDIYFSEGKKGVYFKDVYLSDVTGQISYALAAPINDDVSGKFLGLIVARMKVDYLNKILTDRAGLGQTGETFLVNKDYVMISPSLFLGGDVVLKKKADTENVRNCFHPENSHSYVQYYLDYRGVPIMGTHENLSDMGWCLISKFDKKEIDAPIVRSVVILLAALTVSLLAFLVLGLWLLRRLVRPVEDLRRGVDLIQAGNLNYRVGLKSKDEIGELSLSFDMLVERLQDSYQGLENKIEEKTKSLEEKNKSLEENKLAIMNILEDMEESKVKTESMLANIGDGVIATDSNSSILLVNKKAEELLGVNKDELIGKALAEAVVMVDGRGDKISEEVRPITMAIKTRRPFVTKISDNYYYLSKDGKKIPVAMNASPVVIDNKTVGVINVFRDITREKEIDRMKTEFISLASHQLRTPLSAIRWFVELLMDTKKMTKEQKEYVNNISVSANRMVDLVNSLLNISRIESGRLIVDPKPTKLFELVDQAVKQLAEKAKEKKIRLVVNRNDNLPAINIDPKLVSEVYINLLTNAIKYTPDGGEIEVFVSRKGEEIISQVCDNGMGIPEKEQAKIFERFFRADNVVKTAPDGTGLGLYLTKAIVESSGGKIWFESKQDKGSTFWFSLPVTGSKPHAGEVAINS